MHVYRVVLKMKRWLKRGHSQKVNRHWARLVSDACPIGSTRHLVLITSDSDCGITVVAKEFSFYPENKKAQVELNRTGHDDSICVCCRSNKWVNSHQYNLTSDTDPMLSFSITITITCARLSPVYRNRRENEHRLRSIAQRPFRICPRTLLSLTVKKNVSCYIIRMCKYLTISEHYLLLLVKVLLFIGQLLMLWTPISLAVNTEYEIFFVSSRQTKLILH